MLGLLDRATQLTSIDGKEEHRSDRLHPALFGSGNGRHELAFLLGLHDEVWAAMSAVIQHHVLRHRYCGSRGDTAISIIRLNSHDRRCASVEARA
jgi:hypothetical protein